MARLSLLKRPRHLAAAIAANPGTGNQTIKRPVGFFAMTGIGKLGYHSVLEIGGRVADFSKAINSAGSGKAMCGALDSIQRARQPASILQPNAVI